MGQRSSNYDVLIVGAGPAGLSAAIWCSDLGLASIVIEKGPEKGGQLLHIYNSINNYPGCPTSNGRELRDRFAETVSKFRTEFIHSVEVTDLNAEKLSIETSDGKRFFGKGLIVATGVRRRRLNLPGESNFAGKGVLESGAKEKDDVLNKTVAIIGGGDAALENSLILAETAKAVYVIHRRDEFRARTEFIEKASEHPRVQFILNTEVGAVNGDNFLDSLELRDRRSGETVSLPVDRLLVRIGVEPNSNLLQDKTQLDQHGYAIVDQVGRTKIPGIYAVGDVANPVSPTIATSVGTAAAAVKDIALRLTA